MSYEGTSVSLTPKKSSSGAKRHGTATSQESLITKLRHEVEDSKCLTQNDDTFLKILFPCFDEHRKKAELHFEAIKSHKARQTLVNCVNSSRPENLFYDPVVDLLNEIVSLVNKKNLGGNILKTLHFKVHGRQIFDGDGVGKLKPDIIGYHRTPSSSVPTDSASHDFYWDQIFIPVEVKSSYDMARRQLHTYVRSIWSSQPRHFVLGLLYNHRTSKFWLVIYRRGHVWATKPWSLKKDDGIVNMVALFIGMGSWDRWTQAGFDETTDGTHLCTPSLGIVTIESILCARWCVVGRATRVYTVKLPIPGSERKAISPPQTPRMPLRRSLRLLSNAKGGSSTSRSSATPSVSRISEDQTSQLDVAKLSLQNGDVKQSSKDAEFYSKFRYSAAGRYTVQKEVAPAKCPPKPVFVVKEWFDRSEFPTESSMYAAVGALLPEGRDNVAASIPIGVPAILSTAPVDFSIEDAPLFPNEKFYRPFMRTVFADVGLPLSETKGPRQLVAVLYDAMLGHLSYLINGWLHRDVSDGNILILSEPQTRKAVDSSKLKKYFGLTSLEEILAEISDQDRPCTGVLIDGDNAKDLESGKTNSKGISGTLPFISTALVVAYQEASTTTAHTALDDLESFLWVLVISWFEKYNKKKNGLTPKESRLYENLFSDNANMLESARDSVQLWIIKGDVSDCCKPLLQLAQLWMNASTHHSTKASTLIKSLAEVEGNKKEIEATLKSTILSAYTAFLGAAHSILHPKGGKKCILPERWQTEDEP